MNPKKVALRAAALKVLAEKVKEANDEVRADVLKALDAGDRVSAVYGDDKAALGTVSVTNGRVSAKVSDPDRFAAWVEANYPTEVTYKPVVRESFVKAVLDASKQNGVPVAPDGTLDVPGVVVEQGEPYVSVRRADGAEEVVRRMVADGFMGLDGTVRGELEGGA